MSEELAPCSDVMYLKGTKLRPPFPEGYQLAYFGMGCFWGAEEAFNLKDEIYSVCCGYTAGHVANPTYKQVKSGTTGHAEVIQIVFDPTLISYWSLLKTFWEKHDPTQLNRQGMDHGTQYRSGIYYTSEEQKEQALRSKALYQSALASAGRGEIVTEIEPFTEFYWAEDYHQQYFLKGCEGECGVAGAGISFPE